MKHKTCFILLYWKSRDYDIPSYIGPTNSLLALVDYAKGSGVNEFMEYWIIKVGENGVEIVEMGGNYV